MSYKWPLFFAEVSGLPMAPLTTTRPDLPKRHLKNDDEFFSRDGLTGEMWDQHFWGKWLPGNYILPLQKFKALKGLVDIFELCDGNFHLSSLNFSMIILVPSNDMGNPFVLELLSPTTSEGRGFVGWVPPRFLSFEHSNIKCIGFCPNIGGSNWIYMGVS